MEHLLETKSFWKIFQQHRIETFQFACMPTSMMEINTVNTGVV